MDHIAIDGPAGAGKSTAAKEVAARLGFMYVDTGAMYRTIALECMEKGADIDDEAAVSFVCASSKIRIVYAESVQHMYIGERDVTGLIRTQEAGKAASRVAKYAAVRAKLVELQRKIAKEYDVVMDGRDIGSFVLSDAQLKIFLSASSLCRAKRRYDELKANGQEADLDTIKAEIEKRDYADSHRAISPLEQAKDAVFLDTSDMSIEEVADEIIRRWEAL